MSSLSTLEPGCKQTFKERMAAVPVRLVCQKCKINGYQKKKRSEVEIEKKSTAEGLVCRRKSARKKSNRGCSIIVKTATYLDCEKH